MEALGKYLSPVDLPLERIFLDPNNPRFTGSDWVYVPDSEITETNVQDATRRRLTAGFEVDKLRMNMEVNGYLPIDRIVVRSLCSDNYVVLEGNRRVCAAQSIGKYTSSGDEISDAVHQSLKAIPALVYTGEDSPTDAAWIFQGLRHITGLTDWSAYHKARLLVEQMEKENLTLTEAGKRFGLTPFGAGQWVRGYQAFRQARDETDFVNVIDERVYPYLQEIFGRSSIPVREWMRWNDQKFCFEDKANLNEFISWFYPAASDDEEETGTDGDKSAWDRRVIGKRDDIRQIGYLIQESPKEFLAFRQDGDLEAAYSRAQMAKYERQSEDVDFAGNLFRSMEKCANLIANTPISVLKNAELKETLDQKIADLKAAIALL